MRFMTTTLRRRSPTVAPARRRARGAWLLPFFAWGWSGAGDPAEPTGARLLAVVAVCASAGALWQLLHRRDLVDRLTHFSCAFTLITVTVFALTWGDPVSSSMQAGVGLCAVLTGLVFAEQWLRSRDERATHQRGSTPTTLNTTATSGGNGQQRER